MRSSACAGPTWLRLNLRMSAILPTKEDKLAGIITIQKRTKETLEDDIDMGAILAFCIGNAVQSEAAQRFRRCQVSCEYGQTRCWVTAVTAAHAWAGLSRRKLTMGTQRADRRTWIMRRKARFEESSPF
jgi:hypothetical protein